MNVEVQSVPQSSHGAAAGDVSISSIPPSLLLTTLQLGVIMVEEIVLKNSSQSLLLAKLGCLYGLWMQNCKLG